MHPEWVEYWQLMDVKVPVCTGRNNQELYFSLQRVSYMDMINPALAQ